MGISSVERRAVAAQPTSQLPGCTGGPALWHLLRDPPAGGAAGVRQATDAQERAARRRVLRCAACALEISSADQLFSLRGGLAVQAHANPAGVLFEIMLLRTARNLVVLGPPSATFTWFPGYCWSIALCCGCHAHLGWQFDGSDEPATFFGLVRERLNEAS